MKRPEVVFVIAIAGFAAGCGTKANGREGHHKAAVPQPAPPTPDMTPVEALRTPAGLVLKLDETPAPVTPGPTPSPAAATSGSGS
jgi:hypothetical protein